MSCEVNNYRPVAYHKAGHALIATLHGLVVTRVTVYRIPRHRVRGCVEWYSSVSQTTPSELARVALSGPVAECIFRGERDYDLDSYDFETALQNKDDIDGELRRAHTELELFWFVVEMLADALVKREHLFGVEVCYLLLTSIRDICNNDQIDLQILRRFCNAKHRATEGYGLQSADARL